MKISLINLPWSSIEDPSLGLSILQATCLKNGIQAKSHYFNMILLKYLQHDTYSIIADTWALNDFVFTKIFEEEISQEQINTLINICGGHNSHRKEWAEKFPTISDSVDTILKIRNEVIPKYFEECLQEIIDEKPDCIGITCLFDQTISALAFAKRLKKELNIPIALGGYSVNGDTAKMIVNSFLFIDLVINGDGEQSIIQWIEAIKTNSSYSNISGAVYRLNREVKENKAIKINLNKSPTPFYGDFFDSIKRMKSDNKIFIENKLLPIESSRGCWWGQKSHCVFCGIDKETLIYRNKTPENTIKMLKNLSKEYNTTSFRFVDYILPHSYYKTLFKKIKDCENDYILACEMKSNSDFEIFKAFYQAGFKELQPGIESFNSNVLRKMDKGVSASQNILTLKFGKIFGIKIHYNILYGFPNEEILDYNSLIETVPLLYHLDPPHSCINVLITRNAPMQVNPKRFGYTKPNPHPYYDVIFSKSFLKSSNLSLNDYAYYFETKYEISGELKKLHSLLSYQSDSWISKSKKTYLNYKDYDDYLEFKDMRYFDSEKVLVLNNLERKVYLECDLSIKTAKVISKNTSIPIFEVEKILETLIQKRLVFKDGIKYLGLGISNRI